MRYWNNIIPRGKENCQVFHLTEKQSGNQGEGLITLLALVSATCTRASNQSNDEIKGKAAPDFVKGEYLIFALVIHVTREKQPYKLTRLTSFFNETETTG